MLSQFVFILKIQNQVSFYPFVLREISVLTELTLGHLRYYLTDVPPQPNSPPDNVLNPDHKGWRAPSLSQPMKAKKERARALA
jgi:hypothetical protein